MDDESSLRLVEAEPRSAGSWSRSASCGASTRSTPRPGRRSLRGPGRPLLLHNVHRNRSVPNADFRSEMIVRDCLVHEVDASRCLFDDEFVGCTVLSPTPTAARRRRRPRPADRASSRCPSGGMVDLEVFVNSQVGYEVRFEAVAERGSSPPASPRVGVLHPARPTAGRGAVRCRTTSGPASPARTTSRCRRWVDAVRDGEVGGPSAWDGYAATAVSTAGMDSLPRAGPCRSTRRRPPLYAATTDRGCTGIRPRIPRPPGALTH